MSWKKHLKKILGAAKDAKEAHDKTNPREGQETTRQIDRALGGDGK